MVPSRFQINRRRMWAIVTRNPRLEIQPRIPIYFTMTLMMMMLTMSPRFCLRRGMRMTKKKKTCKG
ncbi:hypothetical protein PIB30_115781, partial [Stylosanthes scabra]|nr:hypothetical protein [Stylosanthes scabra]